MIELGGCAGDGCAVVPLTRMRTNRSVEDPRLGSTSPSGASVDEGGVEGAGGVGPPPPQLGVQGRGAGEYVVTVSPVPRRGMGIVGARGPPRNGNHNVHRWEWNRGLWVVYASPSGGVSGER